MTYKQIKDLVIFWVHRSDLAPIIDQVFQLATERIGKDARLIVMEKALHIDFTATPEPLPADFLAFRSLRANVTGGQRPLKIATGNQLAIRRNTTGASPTHYSLSNNAVQVAPGQEGASVDATYYQQPTPLVNDADTNGVLTRWPSLYLYAAQIYIHNMAQDTESEQVAQGNYQTELDGANESDDNARYSGDTPTMTGS